MSMLRSDLGGDPGECACIIDAKNNTAIIPNAMTDLPNTEVSA
ncbi:hypothetical protein PH562_14175 [Rhizobium sp. CNPSo 4062]|nr:hypothetical protein [Rhizobium sp. CNPSo 4062]MDK4703396.1 hypothetical protein [Rhizobium sp. CNPSo 4062]